MAANRSGGSRFGRTLAERTRSVQNGFVSYREYAASQRVVTGKLCSGLFWHILTCHKRKFLPHLKVFSQSLFYPHVRSEHYAPEFNSECASRKDGRVPGL